MICNFGFICVGANQTHQSRLGKSLLWRVKVPETTPESVLIMRMRM